MTSAIVIAVLGGIVALLSAITFSSCKANKARAPDKPEGKVKYSKAIVITVIVLNVTFTAAVLVLAAFGVTVPPELIVGFFGVMGSELLALAGIKITEEKRAAIKDGAEEEVIG